MANTTNFNWETPDDTDLVKDGAAAIRTLGSAIDTSLVDLKGGTTGQILSKATNTDMDFTWVAQDDSNAIQNAIVDAKGDIITATAADTPARLAVGANDTVLTADSSTATGLKWATASSGGMTLINTGGTALTGSSVTIGSIPGTYNMLILKIENYRGVTDGTTVRIRFNGDDNANRYRFADIGNTAANYTFNTTSGDLGANQDNVATSTAFSYTTIPNYASSTQWKMAQTFAIGNWYLAATEVVIGNTTNVYNQTTAITSIDLFPNSGDFSTGTAYLYGVK